MTERVRVVAVLFLLTHSLVGCGGSDTRPAPLAPSTLQAPLPPSQVIAYRDPVTGVAVTDVHDAQDHVVQFTIGGELVWAANGTRLSGHNAVGPEQPFNNAIEEKSCQCWLVVHFGASNGERRAYLTADYGHFNPRTVVALELVGGALVVSRTDAFPPGTYTLSGTVTEATAAGLSPIENAAVYRLNQEQGGWDETTTDRNGFYQLHGLIDGSRVLGFEKAGYEKIEQASFPVHGDVRFDVQLVRR